MDQQFQALGINTKAEETKAAEPSSSLPFHDHDSDDLVMEAEVVTVAVPVAVPVAVASAGANEPEVLVPLPLDFGMHPPVPEPVPEPIPPVRRQRRLRNRELSQADIEAKTRPLPIEQQMRSDPVAQEVVRVLMDVKESALRLPASIVELIAGYAVTTVCDVWRVSSVFFRFRFRARFFLFSP